MKLGEALSERARIQRRIGELRLRIAANATAQEGTEPSENPNELLVEVEAEHAALSVLISAINRTNAAATVADMSLTAALADRDRLSGLTATLREAARAGRGEGGPRYMRSELKLVRCVDVAALEARADEFSRELRELDALIQEANWREELR